MLNKEEVVILIPAYEPDSKLIKLINDLTTMNYTNILVINDGSSAKTDFIFEEINTFENVKIAKHYVNQGKGRALKTGFNIILNEYTNIVGSVTVDADGQHLPEDIESCAKALVHNNEHLILGVRDFDNEDVPFRSKFGNKLTKTVLNLLVGIKIEDTQTGLRGLSIKNMAKFMKTSGENYEFETNMLIDTKELNINISQVPIRTVYIEDNKTSHFNPIVDSMKIYKVFFKYIISSLSSSIVDIGLFAVLTNLLNTHIPNNYILVSTILARIVSTIFNYRINSDKVFSSENQKEGSFYRYIILAVLQMLASAFLVSIISESFLWNETLTKVIVDVALFFVSFVIQREFVFVSEEVER